MEEQVIRYIKDNINLIDTNNFKTLYSGSIIPTYAIGKVTFLLLEAGINPLNYMDEMPDYYLSGSDTTSFVMPRHIRSISDYAFSGCELLTSVTVPGSVTSIGDGAFMWCYSLTNVVIPDSTKDMAGQPTQDSVKSTA